MLPVWQKVVAPYVDSGKLVVVGVVQEQHPDRARLYRQWRRMDWPIFVDSLNLLGLTVVPLVYVIDEWGVVQAQRIRPSQLTKKVVERSYPALNIPKEYNRASDRPGAEPNALDVDSSHPASSSTLLNRGDACFFGAAGGLDGAVAYYRQAVEANNDDGPAHFRLGVALWRRSESSNTGGKPGDAQRAVGHWGRALSINPNQYVWRRRIQQYGPRLDKPYDFYTWVEQARNDIRARGEHPVPLRAEPMGSEIATALRGKPSSEPPVIPNPDPQGRIHRDTSGLVRVETLVTPSRVRPGHRVRVRLTFRLDEKTRPYWNNEFKGLRTSVALPTGFSIPEGSLTYPNKTKPETQETRVIEYEITIPASEKMRDVAIPAYAIYDVCESVAGTCRHLRSDFKVRFQVDPSAPKVQ